MSPTDEGADGTLDRRAFMERLAGFAVAAGLPRDAPVPPTAPAGTFNGIQMGPHTILDEGIERTLDLIAGTAAVNAVMPYSHAYNAGLVKPLSARADHGMPLTDNARRRFPLVWVRTHEQYYKDTTLRHQAVAPDQEHAGRDLFAELAGPARARGMKVYARILESSAMSRVVANYATVVTRDVNDRPTTTACWNHPQYVAFWAATVEDLFRSYDLDGLQWGAERMGPLMNVISPWNNDPPACFCEHCRAREFRVARSAEERDLLWKGRKSAFSAVGRLSPDFIVQDGVVPRARLGEALAAIEAMSRKHGIRVANVFHAGDGNLHPLILYDGREAGAHDRAEVLAAEIIRLCIGLGGSITGEHGVGLEKRQFLREMYSEADIDCMRRLRLAMDPTELANRGKKLSDAAAGGMSHGLHPLERAGIISRA